VALDDGDQCAGEFARATARNCPTATLTPEDDRVGQGPRTCRVDGLPGLEGHPEHERPDVAALELLAYDVPGTHRRATPPPSCPLAALEQLGEVGARADGREALTTKNILDGVVFGDQPPVRSRIHRREPRDFLA